MGFFLFGLCLLLLRFVVLLLLFALVGLLLLLLLVLLLLVVVLFVAGLLLLLLLLLLHHLLDLAPRVGGLVIGIFGALVVGSVMLIDKIKVDDPVGAISVHLTCGIWGTLAVGIFSTNDEHTFGIQLLGVAAYAAFVAPCAAGLFFAIKATMGLRVSEEEELEGLDLGEHGMHAYDLHTSGSQFDDALGGHAARTAAATSLATEN